jgi:Mn2+/Fe2+ NRAMP family transporter
VDATIGVATFIGLLLNFVHLNPIKALYLSAVLNGVVAGPVMVFMMLLARSPKVMGEFTLSISLQIMGWLATGVMILVSLGLFITISR